MLLTCVTILVTIILGVIAAFKLRFQYWKNQNIPYEEPKIPFGTLTDSILQRESYADLNLLSYKKAKSCGYKHYGLFAFWKPIYFPIDIKIIKNILIKDFNYFLDRNVYVNEIDDPLSAHLFSIEGNKWRNLRAKLSPTFSSGKMKMMFPSFINCAEGLKEAMDDLVSSNDPVDIRDVMGRFTTDIIGSCAFGLECNSFKNPNSDFRRYGRRVLEITLAQSLVVFLGFCSSWLATSLRLKFFPSEVSNFFINVTKQTIDYRLKNKVKRNDFLQLLMDLENDSYDVDDHNKILQGLTMNEMAAQLLLFFVAGYETSSTTMMFCLYELAVNPDLQEKARMEIGSVLDDHDGKITYDSLQNFKYMEQVIDESLRKYPPVPLLNRKCVADYTIPGTDITIEKDTAVFISVLGIHRDPDFYPDPEKFDPERFSDENKSKIAPCTYMPFGEGPRNCLGLRFGKIEIKVALITLLQNYEFTLNDKTETPLKMDPKNLIYTVKNGVWLNVSKI